MMWSRKDSKHLVKAIERTDSPIESASAAIAALVGVLVHHAGGGFTKRVLATIAESIGEDEGLMKETVDEREN